MNKPLLEFGGKGVFVSEFEQGLADGQIDLAVHSAKDLPMDLKEGLEIIAVPEREDPRDVLVTRKKEDLSQKTEIIIGTSSPRRKVQIEEIGKKLWPHACIRCENLRGNVNTRLKRLQEGGYDAILLAAAGLKRLGFLEKDSQELEPFLSNICPVKNLFRQADRESWQLKGERRIAVQKRYVQEQKIKLPAFPSNRTYGSQAFRCGLS